MKYLVLWSGNIRGARKRVIGSVKANLVGHWVDGWPMTFDGDQFRQYIAPQHRKAWDEGRAQAWLPKDDNDSPWQIIFYNYRFKRMATYYCQPLTKGYMTQ